MKVVHLSTSDSGGAGIAASRIHKSLLLQGVQSVFISLYKFRTDIPRSYLFQELYAGSLTRIEKTFKLLGKINQKLGLSEHPYYDLRDKYLANRPPGFEMFSLPFSVYDFEKINIIRNADIVNLHWVTEGFIDYSSFFNKHKNKIVWTLHDMNPFTGGCHHADDCTGFTDNCSLCPQLKGTVDESYSKEVLQVKKESIASLTSDQMSIVAPSQWLTNQSKQSALFKRFSHFNIPNPVDRDVFTLMDKKEARYKLNLPQDKKIVLFIAKDVNNERKGLSFLFRSLYRLESSDVLICSVGNVLQELDQMKHHISLGYVTSEEKMATLYSAADVFVLPSLAENLPNTVCESLMCGTPVVAFNVGGVSELISKKNGIAVPLRNVELLSEAITNVLNRSDAYNPMTISNEAWSKFSGAVVSEKYMQVYHTLTGERTVK